MATMLVMDGAALWSVRKTPVTASDGQGEESIFLPLLSVPYGFTAAKIYLLQIITEIIQ